MSKQVLARQILSALGRGPKISCQQHAGDVLTNHTVKHGAEASACEYAFEMVCSTLRFGIGVTAEIGHDLEGMGAKKTMLLTDTEVAKTPAFAAVVDSLTKQKLEFDVFDKVRVEPTDTSFQEAISFARKGNFDSFVAVGGGSTMDTTKAAALLAGNPKNEMYDFVTKPFGNALTPENPMLPLIAVPTTAGTGSETTGVSIFDIDGKHIKTGIRHRSIKPHLAIVDPLNVQSMPRHVTIYSGFDVLCHALESYTAKPFLDRPRPSTPALRPVYQGSNPISDVWAEQALHIIRHYFGRAVADPEDLEARANMLLASSFAGMGFGNAGVHLCHGLSYPISGQVKEYHSPDYCDQTPLVPHGLSVVTTACADFQFTGVACPQRHLDAAEMLGVDVSNAKSDDAGEILADRVKVFMKDFGVANGLGALGFERRDMESLADGAMNSLSALQLCPREHTKEALHDIYEQSLSVY